MPFFDDRATAHPLASVLQRLTLTGDLDRFRREGTTSPRWTGRANRRYSANYDRVRDDPGWHFHELDGKHDLMRDNPDELIRILLDAGRR